MSIWFISSWFNFHLIFIRVYEEHTIEESSKSAKRKGKVNDGKQNCITTLVTIISKRNVINMLSTATRVFIDMIISLIVIDHDTQDNIR